MGRGVEGPIRTHSRHGVRFCDDDDERHEGVQPLHQVDIGAFHPMRRDEEEAEVHQLTATMGIIGIKCVMSAVK